MLPKVIIDTDIGDDIDDSFALLMAVLSNKMDIIGITTCFRDSRKRARIVKSLLNSISSDIEVYAGEDLPMNKNIIYAEFDKFNNDGEAIMPYYFSEMENLSISSTNAIDFIIDSVKKYPNEITVISIGPLTNLAKVEEKSPETYKLIKSILFMGGQTESIFKEWNVRCDVEAAKKVFSTGVPLKVIGLNVTSQCKLSLEDVAQVMKLEDKDYGSLLKRMLKAYLDFFDGKRLPVMHDPLTIACYYSDFCEYETHRVDVIDKGTERGRTIINPNSSNLEIAVANNVNVKEFLKYMFNTLDMKYNSNY
jgi:purine nucleosidase/pyrimidine-specific ribonucleoside hydrolase